MKHCFGDIISEYPEARNDAPNFRRKFNPNLKEKFYRTEYDYNCAKSLPHTFEVVFEERHDVIRKANYFEDDKIEVKKGNGPAEDENEPADFYNTVRRSFCLFISFTIHAS